MTRNAKRDAARIELLRLLKGLEFYRAWRIADIRKNKGKILEEDLNEIVEPSKSFIKHFDSAGGQYNQILQFVRSWYSHTYSELCYLANTGSVAMSSEVRQFLREFRTEVGFDFQSEAGLVAKIARNAITKGDITRESDYFILVELEANVDQTLLEGSELHAISEMLRRFENRSKILQPKA